MRVFAVLSMLLFVLDATHMKVSLGVSCGLNRKFCFKVDPYELDAAINDPLPGSSKICPGGSEGFTQLGFSEDYDGSVDLTLEIGFRITHTCTSGGQETTKNETHMFDVPLEHNPVVLLAAIELS